MLALDRTKLSEILSSGGEGQIVVWAASYFFGIVVVLPVVVPETHRTNFFFAAAIQRQKTAARTAVALLFLRSVMNVNERCHLSLANVQDEPRPLGAVGSGDWLGSFFICAEISFERDTRAQPQMR